MKDLIEFVAIFLALRFVTRWMEKPLDEGFKMMAEYLCRRYDRRHELDELKALEPKVHALTKADLAQAHAALIAAHSAAATPRLVAVTGIETLSPEGCASLQRSLTWMLQHGMATEVVIHPPPVQPPK